MTLQSPTADDFARARRILAGRVVRTPLVRLNNTGGRDIFLKLEMLQPIGSFKLRGAINALLSRQAQGVRAVTTASAGNFAQGLAYAGRGMGVPVTSIVPDTAARSKIEALKAMGAAVEERPYADWWALMQSSAAGDMGPGFIHPVADAAVIAGNGTIGLEILKDLKGAASILVPFGGGGLAVGIAGAMHTAGSKARVYAVETEAGTPVAAAFAAGRPVKVPFNPNTFITGMGSGGLLEAMWPLVRQDLAGAVEVSLDQTAAAVRRLVVDHHIIAEGAGAAPVAAAMSDASMPGPVVCVVSGGHLDAADLAAILEGRTPAR